MSAGHFEGKLHAYRRTQDGAVISFVIHPDEIKTINDLSSAPFGTRLMIAWSEIGDDEKPKGKRNRAAQGGISATVANRAETPREANKPRRKFEELSAPEQAGILSNDLEFQLFASSRWPVSDVYTAADFIRETCQVKSRADISPDNPHWQCLLNNFRAWQTDQRFADARR